MKKKLLLIFVPSIILISTWLLMENTHTKDTDHLYIEGILPIPTEFNIKKSKRKDFKNQRKEFLENMHRAAPNVNWKDIDKATTKKNTTKVRQIRNNLFSFDRLIPEKKIINISENLNGYWQERGSNNLAGRILTADIDWENNLIYCVSDGGNIWRGSMLSLIHI